MEPFSGVMVMRGMFMTRAKGIDGWLKSASVWVGWAVGGEVGVGGRAVLPLMKRRWGRGPSTEDVICVTIGSFQYVRILQDYDVD